MAIILGLFNAAASITFSVYVLFAQEVLGASTAEFALIMMAGAAGAIVGGWTASWLSKRLGSGPSLAVALAGSAVIEVIIGLMSNVPVVAAMNLLAGVFALLWNVITVSLRQSIIPDRLLGRVNSVYRFLAWGMVPIGALTGGLVVIVTEPCRRSGTGAAHAVVRCRGDRTRPADLRHAAVDDAADGRRTTDGGASAPT